jgi:Spy/CpxP family protein refolding chaperone
MKLLTLVGILIVAGGFLGCASLQSTSTSTQAEKRVERLARHEKPSFKDGEVANRGFHTFFNSADLTQKEKKELLELHSRVYRKSADLKMQIGRYKGVLFKLLVEEEDNEKEIKAIKDKVSELYLERLAIMLSALDKAKEILGKDKARIKKIFKPMLMHTEGVMLEEN